MFLSQRLGSHAHEMILELEITNKEKIKALITFHTLITLQYFEASDF